MIKLVKTAETIQSPSAPDKNFFKVAPVINSSAYHARVDTLPTTFHKGLNPAADNLTLWADCRRASEVVTGGSSALALNDRQVKVNGDVLDGYSGGINRPSGAKNDSTTARLAFQVYASQIGPFMRGRGTQIFVDANLKKQFPELSGLKEAQMLGPLGALGVKAPTDISVAERLYASLTPESKVLFHQRTGTNEYANPDIGDTYGTITEYGMPDFKESGDDWGFHWGGVVMKGGSDNVTLENLSVSNETTLNQKWYFAMYGTADPAQSFHKRQMEGGHHGTIGTTIAAVTVFSTESRRLYALRQEVSRLKQLEANLGVDQRALLLNLALEYNEVADSIGRERISAHELLGDPDRSFSKKDNDAILDQKKRFIPK